MKMLNILILLTALLLIGCSKQELVEDDLFSGTLDNIEETTAKENLRPLKGTVLYKFSPDPIGLICDCDFLAAPDKGKGKMTHMGKVTSESIACVDDIITLPDGTIIFSIFSQCLSVTAANGDEISLELAAPFIMLSDPECGCVTGVGDYNITGGTGRFDDATGLVSIRASNDLAGTVTTEWDGYITY